MYLPAWKMFFPERRSPMVKVITIMDDVYADLDRMKKAKGMSFSQILRFLLKERREEQRGLINLAGSIDEENIDRRAVERVSKGHAWVR
jgi:predicted CopG family antitoxin